MLWLEDGTEIRGARRNGGQWRHWPDGSMPKRLEGTIAAWAWSGPPLPTPDEQGSAILVWAWGDAPGELRNLSHHGGDEDWVGLLPAEEWVPMWMEPGTPFGCCNVQEATLPDGRTVTIGARS